MIGNAKDHHTFVRPNRGLELENVLEEAEELESLISLILPHDSPIPKTSFSGILVLETGGKNLCCNSMSPFSHFLIWLYILRPKANWLLIICYQNTSQLNLLSSRNFFFGILFKYTFQNSTHRKQCTNVFYIWLPRSLCPTTVTVLVWVLRQYRRKPG